VKKRLSIPGTQRKICGFFNTLAIGQTAMMVHVIYEWDTQFFANNQQIPGRVDSIIVF
jgi:hypothetical protein